jgi:hypothetical protein
VHWDDAIAQTVAYLSKPSIENSGLIGIFAPLEFDASTDFGEDKDARPDLTRRRSLDPSGHVGVYSVALADLGYDVRVDQEPHKSTSRQLFWRG